MPCLASHFLLS